MRKVCCRMDCNSGRPLTLPLSRPLPLSPPSPPSLPQTPPPLLLPLLRWRLLLLLLVVRVLSPLQKPRPGHFMTTSKETIPLLHPPRGSAMAVAVAVAVEMEDLGHSLALRCRPGLLLVLLQLVIAVVLQPSHGIWSHPPSPSLPLYPQQQQQQRHHPHHCHCRRHRQLPACPPMSPWNIAKRLQRVLPQTLDSSLETSSPP